MAEPEDLDTRVALAVMEAMGWPDDRTSPIPSRRGHYWRMACGLAATITPLVRQQVSAEIRAHADEHWPPDGNLTGAQAAIRRHLRIAERVALGPTSPADIVEAIRSGNVIVCHVNDIGQSIDPTTDQEPTS